MSFPPGVPLRMGAPVFATTSMPQGTMMVQMQPVPVTQVMMRPVVQQQSFMPALHARPVPAHVVAQSAQLIQRSQLATVQQQQQQQQQQPAAVPSVTSQPPADVDDTGDPAITVFVGNITDRASDTLIRQILMKCGSVFTWKRVQGASGKLQAFGFCEYRDPESALRAIYILHDYKLGDKKLLVKVDAKTQQLIDDWKKKKGFKEGDTDSFELSGVEDANGALSNLMQEYANELATTKEEEEEEKEKKDELLSHNRECPTVRESQNVEENLKELELEEDEKDYISKEIRSFRETQKIQDEKQKKLREDKEKAKLREKERERQREKEREEREKERKDRERSRLRERSRDRSRHRTRSPGRRSPRRSPARRSPRRSPVRRSEHRRMSPYRKRSRSAERRRSVRRSRSRSPTSRRSRRSPSGSPISLRHIEASNDEETDAHERRRIERKIREKEAAYQERLRTFEMRERRKKREIEKQDEREIQQRKEMEREAKRLREFLADYDDERSDTKYYTGSALAKRRREREHEIETDQRDRKKEQEEIDILRKRLIEENHPDPDAAIAKAVRGTEDIWEPLIQPDTPPSNTAVANENGDNSSSSSEDDSASDDNDDNDSGSSSDDDSADKKASKKDKDGSQASQMVPSLQPVNSSSNSANIPPNNHESKPVVDSQPLVKMEFNTSRASTASPSQKGESTAAVKHSDMNDDYENVNGSAPSSSMKHHRAQAATSFGNSTKRKKLTVSDVFNQDEDEDELPKKRKLVPLQYTEEESKVVKSAEEEKKHSEEKRRMVRALIERIPTQKDDLFDYNLDWSMVDNLLMEKRIQPWITKKIIEYIGEEEPTLVEFICSKIMTKSSPEKILEDISMVLDDEAEVFVVKMWRLLIYETEAKKEGLTK